MTSIILSDEDLLKAISAKSQAGAEALYDRYAKVFCLAIFRIVRDQALTDKLLEQTIHHIWDNTALYKEQETRLFKWMLGIAKNLALQQMVQVKLEKKAQLVYYTV